MYQYTLYYSNGPIPHAMPKHCFTGLLFWRIQTVVSLHSYILSLTKISVKASGESFVALVKFVGLFEVNLFLQQEDHEETLLILKI